MPTFRVTLAQVFVAVTIGSFFVIFFTHGPTPELSIVFIAFAILCIVYIEARQIGTSQDRLFGAACLAVMALILELLRLPPVILN